MQSLLFFQTNFLMDIMKKFNENWVLVESNEFKRKYHSNWVTKTLQERDVQFIHFFFFIADWLQCWLYRTKTLFAIDGWKQVPWLNCRWAASTPPCLCAVLQPPHQLILPPVKSAGLCSCFHMKGAVVDRKEMLVPWTWGTHETLQVQGRRAEAIFSEWFGVPEPCPCSLLCLQHTAFLHIQVELSFLYRKASSFMQRERWRRAQDMSCVLWKTCFKQRAAFLVSSPFFSPCPPNQIQKEKEPLSFQKINSLFVLPISFAAKKDSTVFPWYFFLLCSL